MKTALITGASRGIGAGCALAFAREGYNVGINHRSSAKDAESVAQQCRDLGVEAEVFAADVADATEAQALADNDPVNKAGLGFRFETAPMPSIILRTSAGGAAVAG